jgi:hypothetical protein
MLGRRPPRSAGRCPPSPPAPPWQINWGVVLLPPLPRSHLMLDVLPEQLLVTLCLAGGGLTATELARLECVSRALWRPRGGAELRTTGVRATAGVGGGGGQAARHPCCC